MKQLFTLLVLIISTTAFGQNVSKNFSWLIGDWTRTNNQPGKITSESWADGSDTEIKGFGLTLVGTDTVFYEKMTIKKIKDELHFIVSTPEHSDPVTFLVTEYDNSSFTCANPKNDFPKVIKYYKSKNGIAATISAGEKKVDFDFLPKD